MCGLWAAGLPESERALAGLRGRARAALPGGRRHPRRRRLRARGRRRRRAPLADEAAERAQARLAAIDADTSRLAEIVDGLASHGSGPVAEEAARRPARRARPRRVARAGAGARDGRARARPREAGRAGRRAAPLEVEAPPPYVSRGGAQARERARRVRHRRAGSTASTSARRPAASPTCLLQRGAARVIALDVGYGQLHRRLRDDPRVTVLERMNARSLTELPFAPQLVTCDVSFISRPKLALPPALALAAPGWQALVLVKPQFEAGPRRGAEGRRPRPRGASARRPRGRRGRARMRGGAASGS